MNFHEHMKFMYDVENYRITNKYLDIYKLPIELLTIAKANSDTLTNGYYVFDNNIITILEIDDNKIRIIAFSRCRNHRYYYIYINNINKNLLRIHMHRPNKLGTFALKNQTYSSFYDPSISNFEKTIQLNSNYGGFILTNEIPTINYYNDYQYNINRIFIENIRKMSKKNVAIYSHKLFCNYKVDYKILKDNNYLEKIDEFIEDI